jgi:hypothetical protein
LLLLPPPAASFLYTRLATHSMWHQRSGSRLHVASASFLPPTSSLPEPAPLLLQTDSPRQTTVLLPVAGFVFLLYHFSSVSSPNSLLSQDQLQANSGSSALAASFARSVAWAKQRAGGASKRDTEKLVDRLLKVPEDEVGKIAICASIHNEGRFISEWLLYVRSLLSLGDAHTSADHLDVLQNRAVGVDRFYLFVFSFSLPLLPSIPS